MSDNLRPRVARMTWRNRDDSTKDGLRIQVGPGFTFLPWEHVVDTANMLIDALEAKESN